MIVPPDVPEAEEEHDVDDGEQPTSLALADPEALALIAEVDELTESVTGSGFDPRRPPALPQPEKGGSMKDLPKVRSSAFRRTLS